MYPQIYAFRIENKIEKGFVPGILARHTHIVYALSSKKHHFLIKSFDTKYYHCLYFQLTVFSIFIFGKILMDFIAVDHQCFKCPRRLKHL